MNAFLSLFLLTQLLRNPGSFILRQPTSLFRPIREIENRNHSEQDGRNPFDDEQPSPASHAQPRKPKQQARERRTDYVRKRISSVEDCHRLGSVLVAEPVGQIDDHSRQEPCFGGAHQETHPIELSRRVNESHQHGYDSPGNHDASDPAPGTPSLYDQCARNFQQEVPKKENAGAEANHTGAETQVSRHLQSRRSNVHSIQKSNHVEHKQKREKSPRNAAPGAYSDLLLRGRKRYGLCWVINRLGHASQL